MKSERVDELSKNVTFLLLSFVNLPGRNFATIGRNGGPRLASLYLILSGFHGYELIRATILANSAIYPIEFRVIK